MNHNGSIAGYGAYYQPLNHETAGRQICTGRRLPGVHEKRQQPSCGTSVARSEPWWKKPKKQRLGIAWGPCTCRPGQILSEWREVNILRLPENRSFPSFWPSLTHGVFLFTHIFLWPVACGDCRLLVLCAICRLFVHFYLQMRIMLLQIVRIVLQLVCTSYQAMVISPRAQSPASKRAHGVDDCEQFVCQKTYMKWLLLMLLT